MLMMVFGNGYHEKGGCFMKNEPAIIAISRNPNVDADRMDALMLRMAMGMGVMAVIAFAALAVLMPYFMR